MWTTEHPISSPMEPIKLILKDHADRRGDFKRLDIFFLIFILKIL